ncbi:hypothetical protein XbC2_437 [Xanthomonas phage XbC2]|nr:hypothetical protein XbC2_437 [Xanthomonas phage XbC2]
MSKVLKTVSLVTENCEIFTFDAKHLTWIDYSKNQEIRFPYEEDTNEMLCLCFAKDTELLVEETQAFSFDWKNRTDITIVDFVYDDYSVRTMNLTWPDGEENRYLTSHPGQCWRVTPKGQLVFTHVINEHSDFAELAKDLYDLELLDQ